METHKSSKQLMASKTTDINVAHKLLDHYNILAWECLKDTVWWKTSPQKDITLQITGIEYRKMGGLYSRSDVLFVVAVATAKNGESQEILIPISDTSLGSLFGKSEEGMKKEQTLKHGGIKK